jgi:hypothetical protein
MAIVPVETHAERALYHVEQAERLLASRLGLISSYAKAQVRATLAVYYSAKLSNNGQG